MKEKQTEVCYQQQSIYHLLFTGERISGSIPILDRTNYCALLQSVWNKNTILFAFSNHCEELQKPEVNMSPNEFVDEFRINARSQWRNFYNGIKNDLLWKLKKSNT